MYIIPVRLFEGVVGPHEPPGQVSDEGLMRPILNIHVASMDPIFLRHWADFQISHRLHGELWPIPDFPSRARSSSRSETKNYKNDHAAIITIFSKLFEVEDESSHTYRI